MRKILPTLIVIAFSALSITPALGASSTIDTIKKSSENQIRRLVEPLLDKYCHDQCKLLTVNVNVDTAVPAETAPGFDEIPTLAQDALAPTSAKIKILMDDKIGAVSRGKLLDLVQQYLETLDYGVTVENQVTHFPQPIGSEGHVAELREKIAKNFQNTVNELIQRFCPDQCLLTDFSLKTEVVNAEETQYGSPNEFVQDGGVALKIKGISATLLVDESLSPEERDNIVEMARLKTNSYQNVDINGKTLRFPRPTLNADGTIATGIGNGRFVNGKWVASSEKHDQTTKNLNESKQLSSENRQANSTSNSNNNASNETKNNTSETDQKQEKFEHYEKIERVESGDAVQKELKQFQIYALIFGCSVLSLLIFIAIASLRHRFDIKTNMSPSLTPVAPPFDAQADEATRTMAASDGGAPGFASEISSDRATALSHRYEIVHLIDELSSIYAQNPRVARHVFSRILTEEGVEVTAQYIHIFGESVVADILRDPSLQSDMNELMEYYARTTIEMKDSEKYDLLRRLHQKTVAGKLAVIGNRSSTLFDFLAEMDGTQILEMIRNESLTVKAIILTQSDAQKRSAIYAQLDEETRMRLLTELSRIDYLPRDYVFNVANALKRKRRENPRLNTEALPGSEVLVSLLERTGTAMQRDVVKSLEVTNPDSARTVKNKLISIETLRFLRDGQLLEVVLSLRHDELLQFLKGCPPAVKAAVFEKSPQELTVELEEELANLGQVNRESYIAIERKILNRMKLMANDGLINLVETNDRMFSNESGDGSSMPQPAPIVGTINSRRAG